MASRVAVAGAAGLGLLITLACGQASSSLPAGTSTPPPETAPAPTGPPLVKITASGITPQITHVYAPARTVVFLNNDDRAHSIFADPHPAHGQCGGWLNLGPLPAGSQREVTVEPGLCYFHSDEQPGNPAFQGFVLLH